MLRWLYIQLIRLHPAPFRWRFGDDTDAIHAPAAGAAQDMAAIDVGLGLARIEPDRLAIVRKRVDPHENRPFNQGQGQYWNGEGPEIAENSLREWHVADGAEPF